MGKESITKLLSKIFLGELSKTAIVSIFAFVNLPALLVLVAGKVPTILQELFHKPITEWQWATWFLLTSVFLSYSSLLIISTISIHKYKVRKRSYYLFKYQGYQWKLLLPERKLYHHKLPNCPTHGVMLSVYSKENQKCPFCDVSISKEDYFLHPIADHAIETGIAMLDGHYKGPKK